MNMLKKIGGLVFIVAFIVVFIVLMAGDKKIEHIEDTNGADNYSLQTITDENIEKRDIGAKGFASETNNITNKTKYYSKKFTGVTEVDGGTSISSEYTIFIHRFVVKEGNAKLVLLQDDKIVHEFAPSETMQEFTIENADGSYMSLRIAGESAKFELELF